MLKNNVIITFIFLVLVSIPFITSAQSSRATLRATPSQRDVAVGENVIVSVFVRTDDSINALSGVLRYSSNLEITSFSREGSMVNFWIKEPQRENDRISFEGVILNPGFVGNNGRVVRITFRALQAGPASVTFERGSLLANDGLGTNILGGFENASLTILPSSGIIIEENTGEQLEDQKTLTPLPVITEYDEIVGTKGMLRVKGKGAPNELTKLRFEDTSFKTLGEQFILWLQTNKEIPSDVLVQNNENGEFEFSSPSNFVAGSYNITPALVDPEAQVEKPGFGVKVLVEQSPIVRFLVVFINILLLLVPIALLGVIVYFIPWYSRLRMRILKHKTDLEDQEIHLSEVQLQKKTELIGNSK
jgi:hypothetical protein